MQKLNEVADRCNVIEECYEFMLAYAGQGVAGEEGHDSQIRDFLSRGTKALSGLADVYTAAVKEGFGPLEQSRAFIAVLDRDAKDSLAAMELVLVGGLSSTVAAIRPLSRTIAMGVRACICFTQ